MYRTTVTAALAAMMAVSAPLAFAQTAATPPAATEHSATEHSRTSANRVMPGQIRVSQMDGATVYDARNQDVGDVKDIILERDGRVAAVILDVGSVLGVGGKYVAVPISDITVSFDNTNKPRFTVGQTEAQLKSAQAYDLSENDAASGSSSPPAGQQR